MLMIVVVVSTATSSGANHFFVVKFTRVPIVPITSAGNK